MNPYAIFDYMGAIFFFVVVLPMSSPSGVQNNHMAATVSTHRNSTESSGTFRTLRNLHQHTLELSGTCLQNRRQHTPELSRTFRKLPPEPAPATCTGTHRSFSGQFRPNKSLITLLGEKLWLNNVQQFSFLLPQFCILLFLLLGPKKHSPVHWHLSEPSVKAYENIPWVIFVLRKNNQLGFLLAKYILHVALLINYVYNNLVFFYVSFF